MEINWRNRTQIPILSEQYYLTESITCWVNNTFYCCNECFMAVKLIWSNCQNTINVYMLLFWKMLWMTCNPSWVLYIICEYTVPHVEGRLKKCSCSNAHIGNCVNVSSFFITSKVKKQLFICTKRCIIYWFLSWIKTLTLYHPQKWYSWLALVLLLLYRMN